MPADPSLNVYAGAADADVWGAVFGEVWFGATVIVITPPFHVAAKQAYISGSKAGDSFSAGTSAADWYIAGQQAGDSDG